MEGCRNDNIWIMDFPELAKDPDPAIRLALARMDRDANHYTTLARNSRGSPTIPIPKSAPRP